MAAVKCRVHPKYGGLRAPKRTKAYPDGCASCWEYFRNYKYDLAEAERKPKRTRTRKAVDAQVRLAQKENGAKLRVVVDEVTGDLQLMDGPRCMYVCTSEDYVHAFVAGYREGQRKEHNAV